MSLQTYSLTIDLLTADAHPVAGAVVNVSLTKSDVSLLNGQVIDTRIEAETDINGRVVLQLWSNSDGTRSSQYRIRATDPETGKKILDETVTMPAFNCHLRDIVLSPAPSPLPYDAASILAIQQARAEAVIAKDNAEIAANDAALSLSGANDIADQVADSLSAILVLKDDIDLIDQALTEKAAATATHAIEVDTALLAATLAKDTAVQAKTDTLAAKSVAVDAAAQASEAKDDANQVHALNLQVRDDAQLIAQQVSDDLDAYELIKTQTEQAATNANTALAGANLVHQAVVNERVIVTDLKGQCATHEQQSRDFRDATQLLLNQATDKATIATDQATTATTQAGIATTQAGIAANQAQAATDEADRATTTVNAIAGVLAEMATAVINTQTIILSRS